MQITYFLIAIIVLTSFYAWNKPNVLQKWLMNPYLINKQREYHRFLTSGLIHSNYGHLFLNMLALFFFGRNVEMVFNYILGPSGKFVLIGFFLLGIIVSDIPTYLKYKELPHYNSLGASGGVSALVFSSIMFFPLQKIYILFIPFGIPGFIIGILYLAYSYYQSKNMSDGINHDAHFYGAIFGVVFTIIISPGSLANFIKEIANFSLL